MCDINHLTALQISWNFTHPSEWFSFLPLLHECLSDNIACNILQMQCKWVSAFTRHRTTTPLCEMFAMFSWYVLLFLIIIVVPMHLNVIVRMCYLRTHIWRSNSIIWIDGSSSPPSGGGISGMISILVLWFQCLFWILYHFCTRNVHHFQITKVTPQQELNCHPNLNLFPVHSSTK